MLPRFGNWVRFGADQVPSVWIERGVEDDGEKLTAKNALFAGHDEGAAAWGRIASLIETCKMNGVEPYAWLKITLEKIASGHPQSCIRELLPWNFDPASS